MAATIDYGIDLGTTNSAIARQRGMRTDVLATSDGALVPSAVHISAQGAVRVGTEALKMRSADPANTATEFKRVMGTDARIAFPASGRQLTAVELSAEVLKHLVQRARQSGTAVEAAVITIPAMFQLAQCEATQNASKLAGLSYAPLLQEPIAAAIASAGSAELREGYWLIYDFGGGTFDVSLVRSRSGRLQVLDHDGDNHLGGKDFDRILARHAAETVRATGRAGEFRRTDPALAAAFERLKAEAERVRIALSYVEQEEFRVERLLRADDGEWVDVRFAFDREQLTTLITPTILRSCRLCQQVLERNELSASQLTRLVLIGGPTLTPCLSEIIESELGIEARHAVDPMQAVAIGAAVYASTQRIPGRAGRARDSEPGRLELDLSYEPMTNDPSPLVVGKLIGARAPGRWEAHIVGRRRTEAAAIRDDGVFVANLQLELATLNAFEVTIFKDDLPVSVPDTSFTVIHGTTIAKPVLSQSVGIVLADNSVRWYLRKGTVLPARATVSHGTTLNLRRGEAGTAVNVPLVQGESERGDRNAIVGVLRIGSDKLAKDLPAGSEVVVTMTVDEHSTTSAQAYVPLVGQTFDEVISFGLESSNADRIKQDIDQQRARLTELERMADDLDEAPAAEMDERVRMIEELLEEGGRDDLNQAGQLLRKMTMWIDSWEGESRKQHLIKEFESTAASVRSLVENQNAEELRQLNALSREFHNAIERLDFRLADARLQAAKQIEWSVLQRRPEYWNALFAYLSDKILQTERASEARIAIDRGKSAVNQSDLHALIQACLELIRLSPAEAEEAIPDVIRSHVA